MNKRQHSEEVSDDSFKIAQPKKMIREERQMSENSFSACGEPRTESMPRSASSPALDSSDYLRQPPAVFSPVTNEFKAMLQETLATITARFERMEGSLLANIDRRLDRFEARIYEAERRADSLQKEMKKYQSEVQEKSREIGSLRAEIEVLREGTEEREQYLRRDNVRLLGVREEGIETAEETERVVRDIIRKDMGVEQEIDFSIVHRTGPRRDNQPRPIICRLVRKKDKAVIMKNKRKLRQSRPEVSVMEDLTVSRVKLVRDLRQNERIKKVWTMDGKIAVEGHNGARVFNITRKTDLRSLLDRHNRQ